MEIPASSKVNWSPLFTTTAPGGNSAAPRTESNWWQYRRRTEPTNCFQRNTSSTSEFRLAISEFSQQKQTKVAKLWILSGARNGTEGNGDWSGAGSGSSNLRSTVLDFRFSRRRDRCSAHDQAERHQPRARLLRRFIERSFSESNNTKPSGATDGGGTCEFRFQISECRDL